MKTAIEWLKKELEDYGSSSHLKLDWTTFDELYEQAKQIEKEQILKTSKDSYIAGYLDNQCKVDESMNFPEEYYNQTYNQDKY